MKTILFQGDSITDANRSRENDANAGVGYVTLVKGELGLNYPNEYEMYNRGISGNRVIDVYARMKKDIIKLKPDIMSILIGVNDVWHEISRQEGIDADKYFQIYSMLIEEIKEALPDVKIMIMEPFLLSGVATENTEEWPDRFIQFSTEVRKRAVKAKEIAEKFNLPFILLQEKFDEAAKLAPNNYWLRDGVHPTTAGHELIKREWIKYFNEL
ncbi:MAG: SGNH/GDSL hydrolase family protein [Lachnospiraceae bacterium]|nr:SGNH/GDSL hydrolase family protein [Lachnospiraceae bacterium]